MGKRFVVVNETCFVKLISEGGSNIGLCLQGEAQMEEFCKLAIDAYEELLRNKMRCSPLPAAPSRKSGRSWS